jgi:Ras-related protein Rab-18
VRKDSFNTTLYEYFTRDRQIKADNWFRFFHKESDSWSISNRLAGALSLSLTFLIFNADGVRSYVRLEPMKFIVLNAFISPVQIWDTAGQEPTNSLSNAFFRRADVVVLVFDVTEWRTFEAVTEIYESYHQNFDEMNKTIYILVGNKIDRNENRTVTERDAQLWTSTRGCIPCYFTSAKTGEGVNDLFFNVARVCSRGNS